MGDSGTVANIPKLKRPLGEPVEKVAPMSQAEMALDTLASILRVLGENAIEHEGRDPEAFAHLCEQWAQHVSVATPPPGEGAGAGAGPPPPVVPASDRSEGGRRDWAGVREFVRDYCRGSSGHARTVMADLRQVVWVFIQNLNHSFAQEQESDNRIRDQLGRLETLAKGPSTGELKREVLSTVVALGQIVEERRKHQRARVEALGTQVRILGSELETARKEGEVDPVTRLFNRKAFDDYLTRTVELARAFGQPACLLLIDIDRFKTINDTFGHLQGDNVLRRIADAMTRIFLRKSDFVARYGGDELAVVLRETPAKEGIALGDRLLRAVRSIAMEREGVRLQLTVSIGVSELGADEDRRAWLERTDRALYDAKHAGRDRLAAAD
jgi:diguanylate cyclase (GGDEF)-like protein